MHETECSYLAEGAEHSAPVMVSLQRDQVKNAARGNWPWILQQNGIVVKFLTGKHCACPACDGKDGFRFDDKNGDGTYFCNRANRAGDGFDLLMHVNGWPFIEALNRVATTLRITCGVVPRRGLFSKPIDRVEKPADVDSNAAKYVDWLWSNSIPITPGTPAYEYFRSRGNGRYVELACESKNLRWHSGLNYKDGDQDFGKLPAIVARVEKLDGTLVALRRIYLTEDGCKAPGTCKRLTPKLFEKASKGAAIRLFEPEGGRLIVAEGIETTLAAIHLWSTPGWAAGDAGQMESLELPSPDVVREVLIVVDHDASGRGETAAKKLGARLKQEGRTVQLIKPVAVGSDIDDFLNELSISRGSNEISETR